MKIKSAAFCKKLETELSERKRRTRRIESSRLQEVYSRNPEIKKLDDNLATIAFDMGRQLMNAGNSEEIRGLANALIEKKQRERRDLLVSSGFPADYLDPQYECTLCHDTGRVAGGELCRCVVQLAINTVFESSGVSAAQNFRNFDLNLQKNPKDRNVMSRIRDAAEAYANAFPNNERRDLLYQGETGVGKTYLLNCIGGRVLERGYSVLKISAYKLIQLTLDNLRNEPSERPDYILPDLLIIDDLGTEPMIRNITIETLLSIVCERQDLDKATIIATNLSVTDEDGVDTLQSVYGERFASRFMAPRTAKIQRVRTQNVRLSL